VQLARFRARLPELYEDIHTSLHPRDRRLAALAREIVGLASENKLAMLNLAASLLEPGEIYLEVGVWHGLSTVAAMLGNEGREFCAIDDFSEFGGSRVAFQRNLRRYGLHRRMQLIEADCFSVLGSLSAFGGRKVGVFFYDAEHSFEAHFRVLRKVERHLADRALLIVDDTSYPQVRRANELYLRFQPRCRLMFDLPTARDRDPGWWNGVQVLGWRRRPKRKLPSSGAA
jgi:predicted O-methyltransferase YrrM